MPGPGQLDAIVEGLGRYGYSIMDDAVDPALVDALAVAARSCRERGTLAPARTGKLRTEAESVRGDSIAWLDEDSDEPSIRDFLTWCDQLRQTLNEQLFVNLHDVEAHFAIYPPQSGYQKHLDRFATGDQRRTISLVLYLNQVWPPANGGALRLYVDDADSGHVDVLPIGGRLVVFESARFWHQVMPATHERLSIAGWLRTRS